MKKRIPRDTCKKIELTPLIEKTIQLGYNVHLGDSTNIRLGTIKNSGYKLKIGDYSSFSGNNTFYIYGKQNENYKISFGKFCSIAEGASFIASEGHDYSCLTTNTYIFYPKIFISRGKDITIKHDVRIGKNAIIMKGVTIGTGAVVGAGAVVTKDIPPYAIAVGNPAKVIKYRFSEETIEKLLKSEWRNRDIEKIKKNYNLEFIR